MGQKLKPASHWQRQVAKYERKEASATTPTQRSYAQQMKRMAEKNLLASSGGADIVQPPDVLDLQADEYREL